MKTTSTAARDSAWLLAGAVAGALALSLVPPVAQDAGYHRFADGRTFFGVPNFLNVASNALFLLAGIAGLIVSRGKHGAARLAWMILFAGVAGVGFGSAYYHWLPRNDTLVWDRLPMAIGFMGLFSALLGEYVSERLGRTVLAPAVLLGLFSVLYWHWSGDLRIYIAVQALPLLAIPVVMAVFRARYSHQWMLLAALGWYALAKAAELYDQALFDVGGGLVSGHTIKHVLAATACLSLAWMLHARRPLHG